MTNHVREWLIACAVILGTLLVFFGDALFTGKNFLSQGDNVAFYSFIPYLDAANKSGEFPLWMPYIFSGMPSLASFLAAGERTYDIASMAVLGIPRLLGTGTGNDTWRLVLWYGIYGIGVFSLLRIKNLGQGASVFGAVSAVFSTFVMVWIMIGHSTKPVSFATLPWILLALERIRVKFSLGSLLILILALTALVSATHPQMMFYLGCAAALYLLTELIVRLIQKDNPLPVLTAGGALVVATILALSTHADMFLSTREYTPYSTRGSAPLVHVQGSQQEQDGGNDYEYATNWSFSPGEMATFVVPNYFGFGNTKVKMSTGGKEQETNLYWGQMPFTDAANYMGIGVLLLGILGAWYKRKDPFVIFLIVLSLFSLLLSFGKNFSVLYDFFYNYVPAFNKFRAPSMALCLLQFTMPVLAAFGLANVLDDWAGNVKRRKTGMWIAGATAAFLLFGVAYTGINEESYKDDVAHAIMAKQPDRVTSADQISKQYLQVVYDQMKSDWMQTGFLALAFGVLVLLVIRGTLKPSVAIYVAIALSVTDLWRVAARPYHPQEGSPEKNVFRVTDVVNYIKNDKGTFRIADLIGLPANWWAYHFVENVHGYSSAKIRIYQDMLDVAAMGTGSEPRPGNSIIVNPFLWNMLNVKYIVAKQQVMASAPSFTGSDGTLVYANPSVMPRAWFVDTVIVESDRLKTLHHLRDATFNLQTTAYVEQSLPVKPQSPSAGNVVTMTHKENQRIAFNTKTDAERLMVISEVYYPEWHCYVDGKEVPIYRTNFLVRGVVVPAGSHTVELRFSSPAYSLGKTISIASNAIIALVALGSLLLWRRSRSKATVA